MSERRGDPLDHVTGARGRGSIAGRATVAGTAAAVAAAGAVLASVGVRSCINRVAHVLKSAAGHGSEGSSSAEFILQTNKKQSIQ